MRLRSAVIHLFSCGWILIPVVSLFGILTLPGASARAQGLQATYGNRGLETLSYNGVQLVNTAVNAADAYSVYEYELLPSGGTAADYYSWNGGYTTSWDSTHDILTWTYAWGKVACQYATTSTALNMTMTVKNTTSNETVNGVDIFPLAIQFPNMPAGFSQNGVEAGTTSDGPNIQTADYGTGVIDLCNTDVVNNLYCGFFPINNNTSPYTTFTVWTSSLPLSFQPPSLPTFNRPVAAGQSATYTVSLRFGPKGSNGLTMASDITQNFAAQWPFQAKWNDHRSIGVLFLATSQTHPQDNPEGWFNNSTSIDTTTPAGVAAFQQQVMQYAQTSIGILKQNNAQGMIQWDVEGQHYAQPTSYIGDPTLLSTLAPEMDGIADQYFAAFKSAGFQVGLCLRPEQLELSPTAQQNQVSDPATEVINKINYARQRWGCTLFYVDSNVDNNGVTYDASVFQQIANAEPGCLIIPEHSNTKYYAYTAPYAQLTNDDLGTTLEAKTTYPGAFSATYTADGDMTDNYNALVDNVAGGDILMFRSWFDDEPGNGDVRDIYASANAGLPVITSPTSSSGTAGTAFSYQITSTNGPYCFAASTLPAGLAVNATTGLISGTPTAPGKSSVTLTGTNWGGSGSTTLTLTVVNPASPVITSAATATGTVGTAFTYQITATNSPTGYSETGSMPAGLTLNAATGLVTGTPTVSGTYPVTMKATNASGSGSAALHIDIAAAPPVVTSPTSKSGIVGTAFTYTITATNSPTVYTVTGALPAGLTVSSSTGVISGTPTTPGITTVELKATSSHGTGTEMLTITISSPATACNIWALWTPGTTITNGGADNDDNGYNASLIGSTLSFDSNTYTLGPSDAADAWSNLTVNLPPGTYTKLDMIATGVDGIVTGEVFNVNYTDGSTQTFTQNLSDWGNSQGFPNETVLNTQSTRLITNGTSQAFTTHIYGYTFKLNGKSVKSITLPATRQVIAFVFKGHS